MKKKQTDEKRICFLDELRGLAVLCMVFYHGFYVLDSIFGYEWAADLFWFFSPVQPFFAGLFIFLCGVSCSFSRSNVKRGLKILGAAAVVTLFTTVIMPLLGFVECEIRFGILHFLSVSVLIGALFERITVKIPPAIGLVICAVLFFFTSGISSGTLGFGETLSFRLPSEWYQTDWLAPTGIHSPSFYSADYFPIFPYIFVFFAGVFSGKFCKKKGFPEWMYPQRVKLFGLLGRNAFVIYIAHMPLIFILTVIIQFIVGLFAA
jgi:uncharacterized membrane protein